MEINYVDVCYMCSAKVQCVNDYCKAKGIKYRIVGNPYYEQVCTLQIADTETLKTEEQLNKMFGVC